MSVHHPSWDPAAPMAGPLGDLGAASRELEPALFERLKHISSAENLLIATDYDGTIAKLVDRPSQAFPLELNVTAMRALSLLPKTSTAVISGRSLRDLAAMSRLPREVYLVGSHGGEYDIDSFDAVSPEARAVLAQLRQAMDEFLADWPDLIIETKPTGAALHLRGRTAAEVAAATAWIAQVEERLPVSVVAGRDVFDLTVSPASKGDALIELRSRLDSPTVVYIGDDVADEEALKTLTAADLGIRVGAVETTAAAHSVANPAAVSIILTSLFELRRNWLFGRTAVPIERHSLLGNGHSTALLDPDGRVCWMPHPLPHSDSVFSEILGSAAAGYFSVAPVHHPDQPITADSGGDARSRSLSQRYVGNTMGVKTRWPGLSSYDYLAPVPEDSQNTVLVRVLTGTEMAEIRFAPRLDYGARVTSLQVGPGFVRVQHTSEAMVLHAPGLDFSLIEEQGSTTAVARARPSDLPAGRIVLAFVCGGGYSDIDELLHNREDTVRARATGYWENWVEGLNLPEFAREGVIRSAITLRALCHEPTGGVLAAPTTSLPEGIGGVRNWDYRFCWLRDGSMTVRALLSLGSSAEAEGFLHWLGRILEMTPGPENLHPLYAVDGSALTSEAVLEHLPGYAGSRPVRVGNAAEHQVQLDVFGPVAELIRDFSHAHNSIDAGTWDLLCAMVTAVSRRWREADHGIWEARRAPKHNLYTKVMCWVTVDRAVALAESLDHPMPGDWRNLRECIADDILRNGWNEERGAYTVAYGDPEIDAACLFIGLSGLVAPDDPKFLATVDAVERDLRVGPTVFRYRYEDGLPGLEGGFHICTTWLIEAFVLTGRHDEALLLFKQLDALRGPTGLLAEEYDPATEVQLGNHPQAYSHLGYIRVARMISELGMGAN